MNKIKRNIKDSTIIFFIIIGLAAISFGQSPHSIQVAATSNQENAQLISQKLENLGFGTSRIVLEGNLFKVRSKTFDSYAEANFAKDKIKESGFSDSFIVKEQEEEYPANMKLNMDMNLSLNSTAIIDFAPKPKPVERPIVSEDILNQNNDLLDETNLFNKAMSYRNKNQSKDALSAFETFIIRFPNSPKAARAKLMRGYWLLNENRRNEAKDQFGAVTYEHPSQNEHGEARLRLAYIMILNKEPTKSILEQFRMVAMGQIPSDDNSRLDASIRLAALYHKGKDLEASLHTYQAIDNSCNDPEVKAFAQMQRAGIIMELAWNKKVKFSDCRIICDDLVSRYPQVNPQTRATASLMALETFAHIQDHKTVVERGEIFLKQYNQQKREAMVARYWIAKSLIEMSRYQDAIDTLTPVIESELTNKEQFADIDVKRKSFQLMETAIERLKSQ